MGGQRELRRHEPEWHVAPIRSLREPTHANRGNSNADTNRYSHRDSHSHTYADSHSYTYTYTYSYSHFLTYADTHS
jgi:hypothetical protein